MRPALAARRVTVLALLLMLAACSSVAPWQRGAHARRDMARVPEPALAALRDHVVGTREAAQDGTSGVSSGCGCN